MIRRRQRRGLATDLREARQLWSIAGKLKKRDKIVERVGRLKERFIRKPAASSKSAMTATKQPRLEWTWDRAKYRQALATDGGLLVARSNQPGWTAAEFWKTYIQLTIVERAFRSPSRVSSFCGRFGIITAGVRELMFSSAF